MTVEIQEICRQLKPIIGTKADRYWLAYLTEDQDGKRNIDIAIRLLAVKHLGLAVDNPQTFLSVPPRELAEGEYPMGTIRYSDKDYYPFGLREDEWIQHVAIFGRSGAGKTNTVFVLLNDLLVKKKPFLIFDWKRNYRDLLAISDEKILVYTVGRDTSPLVFNPLIPPAGTDPKVWLKKLIEIIAGAYYLGEGVMYLLQEALDAVYRGFGMYDKIPDRYPTFLDVLAWLEENPVKGRKALWMDSTMRGIKSICFGPMGDVVNTPSQPNLAALLNNDAILELDALTNNDKNLIIESMLLWIHHFRLVQPDRECFKHAIFIEEAHHILLKKPGGAGGEAITDTILREIRELGEAIILVDQHPSLISIPALGNSYTTVAMNLKHKSDVNAIAAAMLLGEEESDLFGRLPVGAAVIKLQGRWLQPFQVMIPYRAIQKGAVTDIWVRDVMSHSNDLKDRSLPVPIQKPEIRSAALSEREMTLLTDIVEHPYSGVVERYRRLNVSRRNGDSLKKVLLEQSFVEPVYIATRTGRMVLLEITPQAGRYLTGRGVDRNGERSNEGLEHRFWKHKLAQLFENEGYTVQIEEPVNGFTDLIIGKDGQRVPIEVETGKSDWKHNVEKNLKKGFSTVVVVATNPDSFLKIQAQIQGQVWEKNVLLKSAQELVKL